MNKLTFLVSFAALGLALATLPAEAKDEIVTQSTVVRFADLDLNKIEGARELYSRIEKAARRVCTGREFPRLGRWGSFRQCYDKAVDEAVAKVNRPMLAALHHNATARGTSS
jgi:UrcA family protein